MTPPIHVTVTTDRTGAPIVSKLGRTPDAKARLRREAWVLGSLRHPGVVELVELREVDDDLRLDLALSGSRTLKDSGAYSPSRIAGLLAAVATTLADVHTQGLGHRRLTADHIVFDRNGQPVIAGWAEAGPPHLGDDDQWVDPPVEDVVAVGSLLSELLETVDDRTNRHERGLRRKLTALARTCSAERPPTMHELGTQLARLAGSGGPTASPSDDDARLLLHAGLDDPPEEPPRAPTALVEESSELERGPAERTDQPPPSVAPLLGHDETQTVGEPARLLTLLASPRGLAGAGATAIVLFGVLALMVRGGGSATVSESASPSTTVAEVADSDASVAEDDSGQIDDTVRRPTQALCGVVDRQRGASQSLDTDGDGCADEVVVDRNQVRIGDTTYQIGRPDDTVLVGDWDCDGTATPIVVRPDDRAIHVFARWARPDQGLTAVFGGTLPPDTKAMAVDDGEGCHVLELTGPDGVQRRRLQDMGETR